MGRTKGKSRRSRHENWFKDQGRKLKGLVTPHLFSRERTQKEAFDVQAMLSRVGTLAVVVPEKSQITQHPTGKYEVWTEKRKKTSKYSKPRYRKRTPLPTTKTFNGRIFTLGPYGFTKGEAQREAKKGRAVGSHIRVVHLGGDKGYGLYMRKEAPPQRL